MIAFSGVRTFLQQRNEDPATIVLVTAFLEDFRKGACYAHPFDNGDHQYFFEGDEQRITHLLLINYAIEGGKMRSMVGAWCFDGLSFELADLYILLKHFLVYRGQVKQETVDFDWLRRYVTIRSRWCAFMVGRDHEGPNWTAIYSHPILAGQGMNLLNDAFMRRFRLRL